MRKNIKKIKCSKIYFEILNILEKFYFNFFIVKIVLRKLKIIELNNLQLY